MIFAWWWLIFLIPIPLLLRYLKTKPKSVGLAIELPFGEQITRVENQPTKKSPLTIIGLWLVWLLLIISIMRPQVEDLNQQLPYSGRDMMMVVDISYSMIQYRDFNYNGKLATRMEAARKLTTEFIENRVGDRIGLTLFAEEVFVHSPITFDLETVSQFLNEAQPGYLNSATSIGAAIVEASKTLNNSLVKEKVIIIVSDGEQSVHTVPVEKAAKFAEELGVKIYAIAIIPEQGHVFGLSQAQTSGKDLQTLTNITGGEFFKVRNASELSQVYQVINQLEPTIKDDFSVTPKTDLYFWPLSFAFILWLLLLLTQSAPSILGTSDD